MKKILNFLSSITLISYSILTVTSCGNPKTGSSFYNTDYNKAFGIVFSTKSENQSINFSMLPDLKEVPKPNSEVLRNLALNYANKKVQKLEFKNNEIRLDCKSFICNQNNSFNGKELTRNDYNTTDKDKIIIQYAIDDLAQWFLIPPDFNESIFYNFSNLNLNVNYENNIYFFSKNNDEKSEELILWSKQDSIYISSDNKKMDSSFYFFDENIKLTIDTIDLILNSKNSKIEDIVTIPKKENENQGKQLIINFEDINKKNEFLTKQSVEKLFNYYQNNLNFTEQVEIKKNKNDSKKIYKSDNLKSFKIGNDEIKEIVININFKVEEKGN
ncbi:hypothetical protein [Spiroplasma endosymbiont of Atherix ibis]|uniref:hypothetical protein n=1 Tax=Spiroplasma endosymbiont of Atherix ibis TaxID=3066291 RepID=UPI0030CC06EB